MLARLFAVLSSIAVAVILCELFLRLVPSLQPQGGPKEFVFCNDAGVHVSHPVVGYTEKPFNTYFERVHPTAPWTLHMQNEQGFRDLYNRGDEHVFILGDSMLRGTLGSNHQTIPYLLDLWNQDRSFHSLGTGGYGTVESLLAYREFAGDLPHRLVILQYFLGNDITDNLKTAVLEGDRIVFKIRLKKPPPSGWAGFRDKVVRHSKLLPLIHNLVRSRRSAPDIDQGLEITRRLIEELAREIRGRGADLLIVAVPNWNESMGHDDGLAPDRQRQMLQDFSDNTDGIFFIDTSSELDDARTSEAYGIVDKHLNTYGYYLVAKEIHEWIADHLGGVAANPRPTVPPFEAGDPIVPDCSLIPEMRKRLLNPVPVDGTIAG